jgi:uncharacterized protein YrrD
MIEGYANAGPLSVRCRTDAGVSGNVRSWAISVVGELQMLREVKDVVGSTVAATDGDIGHVRDFYFDDEAWVIRYLIVETGKWLSNRRVLVSPMALREPNWDVDRFPARLTCEQVRNSPSIDIGKPVSRQHEVEFYRYYGYPYYWGRGGLWGAEHYPGAMATGLGCRGSGSDNFSAWIRQEQLAREVEQREDGAPHLRSCGEVTGYHIKAVDGEIGHVHGMLVDEGSWAIRYLIVNTSNWWLGRQVLVAPEWISDVSWSDRTVVIDLTRQAVQEAPPYDPALLPDRPQERLVFEHYGRNGNWQYDTLSPMA